MKRKALRKIFLLTCVSALSAAPAMPAGAAKRSPPIETMKISGSEAESQNAETTGTDSTEADLSSNETAETKTEESIASASVGKSDVASAKIETQHQKESESLEKIPEVEDNILLVESESFIDADGNVTITVSTTEDLVLPLNMMMKGSAEAVSVTINRSGQQIKIKPDNYRVTKAVNGDNEKLPTGAYLTIPDEGGNVYLDFNKPDMGENLFISFLKANFGFLPIAILFGCAYLWYLKNIA